MSSVIKPKTSIALKLVRDMFGIEAEVSSDNVIRWSEDMADDPEGLDQAYETLLSLEDAFLDLGYELMIQDDSEYFGGQLEPVGHGEQPTYPVRRPPGAN